MSATLKNLLDSQTEHCWFDQHALDWVKCTIMNISNRPNVCLGVAFSKPNEGKAKNQSDEDRQEKSWRRSAWKISRQTQDK